MYISKSKYDLLIVQQNSCDYQELPTFFQKTFFKNQENIQIS